MKASTIRTRLEKRYLGAKNAKGYTTVKNFINRKQDGMVYGSLIRPCHTTGRGRHTSNLDYTRDIEHLLTLVGVKFKSGNDAPRGGATGNYIKIITKIDFND